MSRPITKDNIDYHALENRLNDYIAKSLDYRYVSTDFLTPLEQRYAVNYLKNRCDFQIYPQDEESIARCLFFPEYIDQLVTLEGDYRCDSSITQRNLFGALMALGISKSRFGDVWIEDNYAYIMTKREYADYICDNLVSLGKVSISFRILDYLKTPHYSYDIIRGVISSLRLDSIVHLAARTSREKAQELIRRGDVNVNYQTIEKTSYICDNNDIVSIAGVGRFRVGKTGISRKDRIEIEILKFK